MIDHLSIGIKSVAASRAFYDMALAPLGYRLVSADAAALAYGTNDPVLWLLEVERPVRADDKSGLHLCFKAPSRAAVDRFHAAALKAGGKNNGTPGVRTDYGPTYYAAFVLDPDGYRLEAHCETASA